MKFSLVLFALTASLMANADSCQFGSEAIQQVYDRFELFRKTKALDPTDPKIPLTQYSYYETDGVKRLAVKINGVYMVEYYKTADENKIDTKNGQYHVENNVILNYKRDDSGEFDFEDWSNGKKFESTLRSIDAELPNNYAVITETAFNDTSETLDDDMGLATTLEASQSPTTITDELTPSASDTVIMQTTDTVSNSRREITFAYTSPITTNRPSISTYPELRHRVTHPRPYHSKHHHEHHLGPFFEEPLNATSGALLVGVHLATEAVLNCRVGMLKDKTVMWIRRTSDKFSLLTVGNNTYSGDPRIKVKFQYPNNWRLHINPMQKEDAGLYMCQVSTHPPRVFATNVTVLPPALRVVDEQGYEVHDRYYKIGSTIDLTCQIATSYLMNHSASIPEPNNLLQNSDNFKKYQQHNNSTARVKSKGTAEDNYFKKIIWRKDGQPLVGEAVVNISSIPGWLTSRLSMSNAQRIHSGIYSCSVFNTTSAIVDVQILNGETPAAVQHSSASKLFTAVLEIFLSISLVYCTVYISS